MAAEHLLTGNLATPRRTVLGVFGLLERSDITEADVGRFLLECGLPPIAIQEPDIPITREQQLACMARLLERLDPELSVPHHATEVGLGVHITLFGMLGLSLMYAGSLRECLRVITTYAELSWGHSRIVVAREGDQIFQAFAMDGRLPGRTAALQEDLRRYCVTVDLMASVKMTADLFGPEHRPTEVWLPYPAPHDHRKLTRRLGHPVRFDAPEARLYFHERLWRATPLLANPLVFRTYEKLTAQLAQRLRTDVDLSEQVRRLLWMTSPPPDRDSVASMLALSPRTLARRLAEESTSYGELQREVRLARACDYLRNRTLQIAEIAARLGFSDAAAFSRAFRQWTGETPSTWRERELAG
ncbi:MAG: AraC family transcriptional regulator ligand-binding domain-containing protein [Sandaracinaceae bacterium]|nr:AraC family transcriptional regulator ligand-binding domain-containing protein [Sandaracinaceae bacterium]